MVAESSLESSDLYANLKSLQKSLEFLDIQEEYIKDEMKNLKRELIRAKEVNYYPQLQLHPQPHPSFPPSPCPR
jgi:branched-subunit amino acid aminotransferase/4-amino-4-deoxychorismate lyase